MYVITLDNDGFKTVINDDFEILNDAVITRRKNEIPSFTFSIYPSNRGYDQIRMFETLVTVTDSAKGKVIFDGRVLTAPPTMGTDGVVGKSVTCEGILGYLHDSRQGYVMERLWNGNASKNGLQEYIDYILSVHNAHMPAAKQIFRGDVDIQTYRTTENVYKGTNFETTWEIIQSKLLDVFGGEIQARRGSDGRIYLDYKEVLGSERKTPIKKGLNLASSTRSIDPNNVITRLYPRGSKLTETVTDELGNTRETETENRLGIESVNGGRAYIDDYEAIQAFGIIEGVNEWDDVTDPNNLLTKAQEWLKANNRLPMTTTVDAIDLSLIDESYQPFEIHNWHPVLNDLNDIDETLEIVAQTINLVDPPSSTIELGESSTLQSQKLAKLEGLKGQVEYLESQSVTTKTNIEYYVKYTMSAVEIAEDRIRSTVGEQMVAIGDTITVVSERVSQVEQTAQSIVSTISDLRQDMETGQTLLQTQIEQTATSITSTVSAAAKEYTDGQLALVNQQMSEIKQTINGISLTVTDGKLGSSASIKMTVGDKTATGTLDLSGVREAFKNDNSQIRITAGRVTFASGIFVIDSGNFQVDANGKITATAGQIAKWTIGNNSLYNTKSSLTAAASGVYLGTDGISLGPSSTFKVTSAGELTAVKGKIAGFTITQNKIYNTRIELTEIGLTIKNTSGALVGSLYGTMSGNLKVIWLGNGVSVSPAAVWISSGSGMGFAYYQNQHGGYGANTLHHFGNTSLHGNSLQDARFKTSSTWFTDGITGSTRTFIIPRGVNKATGTLTLWTEGCILSFTRGILTSATW